MDFAGVTNAHPCQQNAVANLINIFTIVNYDSRVVIQAILKLLHF